MKHENNYDGKTDRPCIRQTPAVSLLALRSKLLILNAAREDSLRSEEHTSELQSQSNLVCRLLLEKKKMNNFDSISICVRRPACYQSVCADADLVRSHATSTSTKSAHQRRALPTTHSPRCLVPYVF